MGLSRWAAGFQPGWLDRPLWEYGLPGHPDARFPGRAGFHDIQFQDPHRQRRAVIRTKLIGIGAGKTRRANQNDCWQGRAIEKQRKRAPVCRTGLGKEHATHFYLLNQPLDHPLQAYAPGQLPD